MIPPTVSVITPTYNAEKTLGACLASVAQQTYQAMEHWIIDGGSTDGTLAIVEAFSQQHNHIHYLSEPDQGIYDAMNKGICQARGHWLYFLGGDDTLYDQEVLMTILGNPANKHYDVLYGNVKSAAFTYFSPNGVYGNIFSADKLLQTNISHQAIFVRKSVYEQIGTFDLNYPMHADWEHNLRWFLNPAIKHRYCEVVVANFAAGGHSAQFQDPLFRQNRYRLALQHDKGVLSEQTKRKLYLRMLIEPIKNKTLRIWWVNLFFIIRHFWFQATQNQKKDVF